ncbi:MAG: ATP-grasp domain-containing protein [Candidatus Binatia bacterium]
MAHVFVTDAQRRKSLAVVRSLGRRGIRVTAGEETRNAVAFYSRYCDQAVVYPSPTRTPELFIEWLLEEVLRHRYTAVIPTNEQTLTPISQHLEELSKHTVVPIPDFQTYMRARDKAQTMRVAAEQGIPCPRTYAVDGPDSLDALEKNLDYPVVIKPREGSGSSGVTYVKRRGEFKASYLRIDRQYPKPLVQEFIPPGGAACGVSALFDRNSEPLAVFVHKRLREYPVSGGPSTLRESVCDPELAALGVRMLKALKWYGVAMVEFKTDPRDQQPKLMEVNPKFWGSLELAIHAGVDFPYLLYKLAAEGAVEPVRDYRVGVRCRWLPGDFLHFLFAPNRLKLIPEFFNFFDERTHYDVFSSKDDIKPMFGLLRFSLTRSFDPSMWKYILYRQQ